MVLNLFLRLSLYHAAHSLLRCQRIVHWLLLQGFNWQTYRQFNNAQDLLYNDQGTDTT